MDLDLDAAPRRTPFQLAVHVRVGLDGHEVAA
jgi:hypothetical protein